MQFSYTYLKQAADNKIKIGNWKGMDVYAISRDRIYTDANDSYCYVIYDDDNLLYYRDRVYAKVSKYGDVSEFNSRVYHYPQPEKKNKVVEITTTAPAAESVVADVALGLLVEDTLKGARNLTIDSLLEGFNYGLT